ncbi:MAG: hypothetical protein OHK0029_34340 [Armatimonadaceae bacterium]
MSQRISRRTATAVISQTMLVASTAHAHSREPNPAIDPKAKAILKANEEAMIVLRSYSAECWTTLESGKSEKYPNGRQETDMSQLVAVKPNQMRYDGWEMKRAEDGSFKKRKEGPTYIFACDGKQHFQQYGDFYCVNSNTGPEYLHTILEPWNGFYTSASSHFSSFAYYEKEEKTLEQLEVIGAESVEGVSCNVISFKYHTMYNGKRQDYEGKLYVGPDKLVRRKLETVRFEGGSGFTRDSVLRKIRTNVPSPSAKTFAYTPPAGVKKREEMQRPALLAKGTTAPDFTAHDLEGKPVKLSDLRGKVVVLDFWATWCGPCLASMPHTNEVAKQFKDQGVVVLAVNVWDEPDAFKSWVPNNSEKYDTIRFVLDPNGKSNDVAKSLYNVSGIPTQYVVSDKGIVLASFLGAPPPGKLEEAITSALQSK